MIFQISSKGWCLNRRISFLQDKSESVLKSEGATILAVTLFFFRVLRLCLCVCVTVAGWNMVTIEVRQKENNCTSLLRLAFLKYLGHTKGLAYARIRKPLSSRRRLRRRIDFYLLAQRKRYSLIRQASEAGNVNVIIINTTFELFCWKGSLNCTLPFCRNNGSSADMATSKVDSFFYMKICRKKTS